MTKKVDIGLDIGIASVGWALVDAENSKIIKHGVRLFETMDDKKAGKLENEQRREARSARRQTNRRRTLKRDFAKFLLDQKFITDIELDHKSVFFQTFKDKYIIKNIEGLDSKDNKGLGLFQLREKGLKHKLSKNELIKVLYWYINHRGFKYKVVNEKDDDSSKKYISIEDKIKGLGYPFPVLQQLEYYKLTGFLNGTFNRIFHQDDYKKEIKSIFEKQELTKDFIDGFMGLFERQRSFEEGPSSLEVVKAQYKNLKSTDNFVIPFTRFKVENGKISENKTMWEASVGKCSYYIDEYRAPKESLTAQLFNLLNDINNLSISGEKLTPKDKNQIINISIKYKKNSNQIIEYLKKKYDLDNEERIKGYRIDKKRKPLFTPLLSFHIFNKILKEDITETKQLFEKSQLFDDLSIVLNKSTVIETRQKELKKIYPNNELLCEGIAKIKESFSQTHSFSFKAMQEMIPFLREETINQMEWIQRNPKQEDGKSKNDDWINEMIQTPTVKRSLRESIKVFEALIDIANKENYEISNVVIELARENNNKTKRDNETQRQKYFEESNKEISEYLSKNTSGDNGVSKNRTREKLWLLLQQNSCDAYTGQKLDAKEVINYPNHFDIDHIIPHSQTFDNSRENKVLTRSKVNRDKSNRTPYLEMSQENFAKMEKLWREWYITSPKNPKVYKSLGKFERLTSKIDYSKPENQLGFLSRNLVDTRYTTREMLHYLKRYSKDNNLNFKVVPVNGKMTSFARRNLENSKSGFRLKRPDDLGNQFDDKNKKTRIWHGHHAEDAYLITIINHHYRDSKTIEKILSNPHVTHLRFTVNNQEISEKTAFETRYSNFKASFDDAREELNNKMIDMTFSRKISTKKNTQLYNETLYEGKNTQNKKGEEEIQQYRYIKLLKLDSKKCEEWFEEGKKSDLLLIKLSNRKMFDRLKDIANNYINEKLPFKVALSKMQEKGSIQYQFPKKLKYLSASKKIDEVIFAPNNNNSFYESMNWVELHIFKDEKGKFVIVPITALVAKFAKNNFKLTEKYDELLKNKNLNKDQKVMILKKYDCLKLPNDEIWYVVGHVAKQGKIELKPIHRNKVIDDQRHKTINYSLKNANFVKLNVLGDIVKESKLF